ncbi:hypothetical protein CBOM_07826 [Ceraceosorus bombacis]|uniref:Uncharacterized protein n=1 Tax=Ceraceosorus bombacis TaxID=401625 RepID=A0A0P1BML2_9BASI|nr:hypothetical protein CBOM_07826 [Ceraceosorus bombacis]
MKGWNSLMCFMTPCTQGGRCVGERRVVPILAATPSHQTSPASIPLSSIMPVECAHSMSCASFQRFYTHPPIALPSQHVVDRHGHDIQWAG